MHFPDTYKTPYHKTFSNESIYALPTAPHWEGDQLVDQNGNIVFDDTAQGSTAAEGAHMDGLLTVPSDTQDPDSQDDDLLSRLRKTGILRASLQGNLDIPYKLVSAPILPAAAGTGLSDEAQEPPISSLLDAASGG